MSIINKVLDVFKSKSATVQLVLTLAEHWTEEHKDQIIHLLINQIPIIKDTATPSEITELFEAAMVFKAKLQAVLTP